MKKLITVLITLSVALAIAVGVMAFEANVPKVVQPGDVNADGSIDSKDIVLLAQYLAKWEVQLGGDSHTVVIDGAVEPTCKTTGLTEGKHCSDCGMILVKQQVMPTTDHDFKETVVPPTETEKGYTLHKCEDCGYEEKDSFTNATLAKGLEYKIENGACTIIGIGTCEETELYIPDTIENCNVTAIADKAFSEQTQLKKVVLPKYIKTLGQRAFYGCTGLTEFTIPASVTSIGHQVFYKCDNLATVYYNSSLRDKVFLNIPSIKTVIFGGTTVPNSICYNCTNIEKVEILDNVTSIGSYAFEGCGSLTSVTIPESVTSIGYNVFEGCGSLKNLYITDLESWLNVKLNNAFSHPLRSTGGNLYIKGELATDITIPDSVTSIGSSAFSGCSSLTSVTIPDSVTSIGGSVFRGCSSLTSVTIPNSVTSIGSDAFGGCSSLTSVTIPDSVTSIGDWAFQNCRSLTSVTIPDSVTSIGNYAFYGCSSLTSVTIPDSVTSIGYEAFYNCRSLKTVYYGGTASEWTNILIGVNNTNLTSATRYYYSSAQPVKNGNYWRYVDGVPTPW